MLALGFTALNRMDLRTRLQPFILSLHREHKVNVNLGILNEGEVLIVERLNAAHIANLDLKVGDRLPALTSSLGRAILAHLPEKEAEATFRSNPPRKLTPHTITEKKHLWAQLENVRVRGYARASQEMALGWVNHAVPIFEQNRVQAALGVACPSGISEAPDRLKALLASLLDVGRAASGKTAAG